MNSFICADCLDIMQKMPDNSVDLVVTSPPYDNLRDYKGYYFDFEGIAKELYRITKNGGVVVWVVGDATINGSETGTSFKQALYFKEIGFNLHDTMIYKSQKPPLTHNRYEQCFEYMFVISKGKPNVFKPLKVSTNYSGALKKYNYGDLTDAKQENKKSVRWSDRKTIVSEMKIKSNIWDYATGLHGSTSDTEAFEHPAIFPEKLARDHIISWSNEGDLVLDPFSGSGTTCKMAYRYKRKFLGVEMSEKYCKIAKKRLMYEMMQTTLF